MSTQITKLEQAVHDWKAGMTPEEAAQKNGIKKEQLERAISLALNPMADEDDSVGDSAAFKRIKQDIQEKPVATATLENPDPSKRTTIVVYERNGQKEAYAYDSKGELVNLDAVYKEYGIESTTIDSDGRLAFKGSKDFEYSQDGMRQPSGKITYWDKFTNFFNGKNSVVAGERQYAQTGKDNVYDKQLKAGSEALAEATKNIPNDVKAEVATLAKECQAKLKAGDTEGAKEANSKLAEFFKEHPDFAKTLEVAMQAIPDVPKEAVLGFIKGTGAALMLPLEMLASCSSDITQEQHVAITVDQNSSLEDALNAILQNQEVTNTILQKILEREISNGMTLDEIKDLAGGNTKLLVALIDAMSENNNLLTEIKDNVGNGFENVLSAIVDVKQSVQTLTDLVAEFPQYKNELNEIINGIKTGNTTMTQMKALIEELLKKANANGDVQVNILNKLTEIENSNKSDGEKLAAMLKLLGEIKAGIEGIADGLKEHFKNDATVNSYLEKILAEAQKNNAKADETNALLKAIYTLVEKLGKDGDKLGKEILNYIAAVGFEMNRNFTAVLEAINNGVAGADSLRDLLEKVLDKQDKNTKAIIDAIGNIKINGGGTVDLSSLEAMVAELLKQSKANGNILSNIDAKTDVIATTTKSILAALEKEFGKNDERYKNINNILNVIANKDSGKGDDTKLLAKLDEILAKLDEIKDAIKDHKVQVDVTGKVTCECNCGNDNKHEGILGDLNELLN